MFYRMNLTMSQEFSDKEEIVKDPLAYAVKTTITFDEFKANSWGAFDALLAAIRFRAFYMRCRLLIDPYYSIICILLVLGVFIMTLVYVQIWATISNPQISDLTKIHSAISSIVIVVLLFWWAIVERASI